MRLFLALFLLLAIAPATAQTFPPLSGRVVDAADILPPDVEAAITARSQTLEAQTTTQLVVATIADLEGYPIEDYGYRLGRHWGIGQEGQNNGVILIIAPNDRKVRIEVGYGLEPVLTDALSSYILQQQVLPRFRQGDFPGGTLAGAEALAAQLELPPDEARAAVEKAAASRSEEGVPFGVFIFLLFFLLWMWMAIRASRRGRRRGGVAGPVIIWGPGMGGSWGGGGKSGWGGGGWGGGGGFGGGGGGFGGGGASGGW